MRIKGWMIDAALVLFGVIGLTLMLGDPTTWGMVP